MDFLCPHVCPLGAELGQKVFVEHTFKTNTTDLGSSKIVEGKSSYIIQKDATEASTTSVLVEKFTLVLACMILGFGIRSLFKGKVAKGLLEMIGAVLSQIPDFGPAASLALALGFGFGASFFNHRRRKLSTLPKSFDPEPKGRLDVRSKFQTREEQEIDDKENLLFICIFIGSRLFLIWSKAILMGSKIILRDPKMISTRSGVIFRESEIRSFFFSKEGIKNIKNE